MFRHMSTLKHQFWFGGWEGGRQKMERNQTLTEYDYKYMVVYDCT